MRIVFKFIRALGEKGTRDACGTAVVEVDNHQKTFELLGKTSVKSYISFYSHISFYSQGLFMK